MSLSSENENGSSPYTEEIDVAIDGYHTQWGKVVPAGDYTITTTFTISPKKTF